MNRSICQVLSEMRDCFESRNFAGLKGLVEEAQSMANRMEAALWDQRTYKSRMAQVKQIKADIEKLKKEREKLGGKKATGYDE